MNELIRLTERAEAEAMADLYRAAPPALAEALGLRVEAFGDGVALVAARIDAAEFNRAFAFGLERPADPGLIDRAVALYAPLGLKLARLQPSPAAEPQAALERRGIELGLPPRGTWTKFARPADRPAPEITTSLRIAEAAPDEAAAFGETVAAGFGMPPPLAPWLAAVVGRPGWRAYIAWDGDRPVGGAALFLGEDYGWLGIGAVLPEARRRGGQGALMARRLADTARAGKAWAVTETGTRVEGAPSPSYDNMVRCGFDIVSLRPNWLIPAKA